MKAIAQRELRSDNARVVDAVVAGETFVITRNGEPVAELAPLRSPRPVFARRADIAWLARAEVRIDREQCRDDLDSAIDQQL